MHHSESEIAAAAVFPVAQSGWPSKTGAAGRERSLSHEPRCDLSHRKGVSTQLWVASRGTGNGIRGRAGREGHCGSTARSSMPAASMLVERLAAQTTNDSPQPHVDFTLGF